MAGNNPFIHYKIYSTPTLHDRERFRVGPEIKILCLILDTERTDQPFLQKVLEAARIDPQTCAIHTLMEEDTFIASSQSWFSQLEYLMTFGIPLHRIGMQIPEKWYECLWTQDLGIMQMPRLSKIKDDKMEKQKLWNLMKNEFINE